MICLDSAAISLILWTLTKNTIISVILISLVSALGGFAPTFRKSYNHPEKETILTYVLNVINLILSILSLESFTFTNALYPFIATILNGSLVLFLKIRRKQLAKIVNSLGTKDLKK